MFGKKHFYLMYGPLATKDKGVFEAWKRQAETEGIRPLSYKYDKITETATEAFVMGVTLIECRELWKGALKSWLKRHDMEDLKTEKDGLRIYA